MAQTIQTKKAKDLAQETSSAKMQTAKAIIWNPGEELKQVSVNTLVNNNVTKDAVPTEGSANPITSGGVFTALGNKEDMAYVIEFVNGDDNYAEDNWIYVGKEAISEWTLMPGSNVESKTFAISFDTAASGTITITLPQSIKFTETPTFGNNEHWEIAVRNGYAVYTKYDLA